MVSPSYSKWDMALSHVHPNRLPCVVSDSFCAFIGNCCANDDVLAEAEKERKWRERRDDEESYLLAALPLVAPKLATLEVA